MADFPAVYGAQQAIYPVSFLHVAGGVERKIRGKSCKRGQSRVRRRSLVTNPQIPSPLSSTPPPLQRPLFARRSVSRLRNGLHIEIVRPILVVACKLLPPPGDFDNQRSFIFVLARMTRFDIALASPLPPSPPLPKSPHHDDGRRWTGRGFPHFPVLRREGGTCSNGSFHGDFGRKRSTPLESSGIIIGRRRF